MGNHISYLDIPVIMSTHPSIFVAKNEISTWPIFSSASKAASTIFVKRGSKKAINVLREGLEKQVLNNNRHVVIFPSGTTSANEEKPWKKTLFHIAKDLSIKVQPFKLSYTSPQKVAFLEKDLLLPHLYNQTGTSNINVTIEFGKPTMITEPKKQAQILRQWTQNKTSNNHYETF